MKSSAAVVILRFSAFATMLEQVSEPLGLQDEYRRLDNIIATLLGTRHAPLESPSAIARAAGLPYDPERLDLFQRLFTELAGTAPVTRLARPSDGPALPFFEAYFSNFIEGTEFAVDEAEDIVFRGQIPKSRREDAHDVLGTWRVVSDDREMSLLPRRFVRTRGPSEKPSCRHHGRASG